jgi:hypothetical protein
MATQTVYMCLTVFVHPAASCSDHLLLSIPHVCYVWCLNPIQSPHSNGIKHLKKNRLVPQISAPPAQAPRPLPHESVGDALGTGFGGTKKLWEMDGTSSILQSICEILWANSPKNPPVITRGLLVNPSFCVNFPAWNLHLVQGFSIANDDCEMKIKVQPF